MSGNLGRHDNCHIFTKINGEYRKSQTSPKWGNLFESGIIGRLTDPQSQYPLKSHPLNHTSNLIRSLAQRIDNWYDGSTFLNGLADIYIVIRPSQLRIDDALQSGNITPFHGLVHTGTVTMIVYVWVGNTWRIPNWCLYTTWTTNRRLYTT